MRYPLSRKQVNYIIRVAFAVLVFLLGSSVYSSDDTPSSAELPRLSVDSALPESTGRIITVSTSDNLQSTLEEAVPGDVIELEPGVVYRGPFTLPKKDGSDWIIIRTADPEGKLPQPGSRVSPNDAVSMARLESRRGSVVTAAPGAARYRFVGIEFGPEAGRFINNLIDLGSGSKTLEEVPSYIVFDRCLIRGDRKVGGRRGIAMNSAHTAVIHSHISDFKEVGADSQAIAGWNGPGPFKIVNNYLEGAGENVMFGGADPRIPGLVPSDIEIRGNHFSKPLSWRGRGNSRSGAEWTVKNLFELKNARRVLIEGNLFENNWVHGQDGTAILFTVRNQDGNSPWSVVEDVQFVNNVVRRSGNGVTILGNDNNYKSKTTQRILISNNVFYDIGPDWGRGVFLLLLDGTIDVVVENNTIRQAHNIILSSDERPHRGFVFSRNIVEHNDYGIIASGKGFGIPTLEEYFPESVVGDNIIVGGSKRHYPKGNVFPISSKDVGFKSEKLSDYRLLARNDSPVDEARTSSAGADYYKLCSAFSTHSSRKVDFLSCSAIE
jgi:hypothetical protein